MKRKLPSKPTESRKEAKLSPTEHHSQMYQIVGLKKNKLQLCPIEPKDVGLRPGSKYVITIYIHDYSNDDDYNSVLLSQIPGFEHGGLDLCGSVVGKEKDLRTTVKDIRDRMQEMTHRKSATEELVLCVARTLLPVYKKMWNEDSFGSDDGIQILMNFDGSIKNFEVSTSFTEGHVFLPGEIKWLGEMHTQLLLAFSEHGNEWTDCLPCPSQISFEYSGDSKTSKQWLQIVVTAKRELNGPWTKYDQRLYTTFSISQKKDGSVGWKFTREPLPFSEEPEQFKGTTTWTKGFPPLEPNYAKKFLQI